MKYVAFQNRKSGLLLSGTDFNYSPPRHRYAADTRTPLLLPAVDAPGIPAKIAIAAEAVRRNLSPRMFKIVTLTIRETETDEQLRAAAVDLYKEIRRQRGKD